MTLQDENRILDTVKKIKAETSQDLCLVHDDLELCNDSAALESHSGNCQEDQGRNGSRPALWT